MMSLRRASAEARTVHALRDVSVEPEAQLKYTKHRMDSTCAVCRLTPIGRGRREPNNVLQHVQTRRRLHLAGQNLLFPQYRIGLLAAAVPSERLSKVLYLRPFLVSSCRGWLSPGHSSPLAHRGS